MLKCAQEDVRTTTRSNLRNILLLTSLLHIDELQSSSVTNIKYNVMEDMDKWRVNMVGELIEMKHGKLEIPDGWDDDELEALLFFACTS